MKAVRLHEIGRKLSVDDIPIPNIGDYDVLIRIKASGLCHSDINYRDGISPVGKLPITLGHEISGVVAEVGRNVREFIEGDRVLVHYIVSCGRCRFCSMGRENLCSEYKMIGKDLDGGFAEYITVPERSVLRIPDNIPFDEAAIMGCAVSTPYHALRRSMIEPGDTVVVYGVGGLGIHAVQLANKIFGAGKIIAVDISDKKLKLAMEMGADEVVNALSEDPIEKVGEYTGGEYADIVMDFVGLKKTIEDGVKCVGKGGKLVLVGIGRENIELSPYKTIIGKEMEIIGVNDHLKSELFQLIKLVSNGKIDLSRSITHRISLEEINHGMEILEKNIGDPIRIVAIQ